MDKQIFKIVSISLILVVALASIFFLVQKNSDTKQTETVKLPTSVAAENLPDPTSQVSPDGSHTLTLKSSTSGAQTTYSFYTADKLLLSTTIPTESYFSIPFNTFSPDNKYVFVKEVTPTKTNYHVLPGNINVTTLFAEKYPAYTLQEITGWAAPNLLIVNASTGTSNISLWFDLTTTSFITLSNRFN